MRHHRQTNQRIPPPERSTTHPPAATARKQTPAYGPFGFATPDRLLRAQKQDVSGQSCHAVHSPSALPAEAIPRNLTRHLSDSVGDRLLHDKQLRAPVRSTKETRRGHKGLLFGARAAEGSVPGGSRQRVGQ